MKYKKLNLALLLIFFIVGTHTPIIFAADNETINDSLVEEVILDEEIAELVNEVENESFEELSENPIEEDELDYNESLENNETENFDNETFQNNTFALNNFSEEEYEYVDLDEIINDGLEENNTLEEVFEDNSENDVLDEVDVEKKEVRCSRNGKVELVYDSETGSCDEKIIKKEIISRGNVLEKKIVISSEDHFDDEVIVYTDLIVPAEEQNIVIYWETNDTYVDSGIEYFDEDSDGLVERVSWVVPHLSTQTYTVEVLIIDSGTSPTIEIEAFVPENGTIVSNPVEFAFNISYYDIDNLNCYLTIDSVPNSLSFDSSGWNTTLELDEGIRNWLMDCSDGSNFSSVSGFFEVIDSFEILDQLDNVYFTDEEITFEVNSSGGSIDVELEGPSGVNISIVDGYSGSFPYEVDLSTAVNAPGEYTVYVVSDYYSSDAVIFEEFDVAGIDTTFDSSVDLGNNVNVNYNYGGGVGGFVYLYEDDDSKVYQTLSSGSSNIDISYPSDNEGSFELTLEVNIAAGFKNGSLKTYEVDVGTLSVTSGTDTTDPEIDLQYPDWEEEIPSSSITFEYSASDNVGLVNCSLEIFNATVNSAGVYETGELIFPKSSSDKALALENNPANDGNIEVALVSFDEGNYIWEVTCFDAEGNEGWDFNHFSVDLNGTSTASSRGTNQDIDNYERRDEVLGLIDSINEFLEAKDSFNADEIEVVNVLELDTDLNFYKKRLLQIDQDLSFNLRFMEPGRRETRTAEIYSEIDEIKADVLTGLEVSNVYEYSKTSFDIDMMDFIREYMAAKNTDVVNGVIKKLAAINSELQKELSSDVIVREITLNYVNGEKTVILVEKVLKIDEEFEGEILEVLPEDFEHNIIIDSFSEVSENRIYEISSNDFEDRIIYYFEESFDLKEIEGTETLLFTDEGDTESSPLTGFFVSEFDGAGSVLGIVLIVLFLGSFMGFFIFQRVRLEMWKKEPNVVRILDIISHSKMLVRENQLDAARGNYHQMGDIYKVLPEQCKNFFFKEIEKVRIAIDKKDVLNLLNEYESARREFRKNDAVAIHQRISEIYKKLPNKFQEKVYQRLVKGQV